jgi:hypothetical protein
LILDLAYPRRIGYKKQPKITSKRDKDNFGLMPKHPSTFIYVINTRIEKG